MARMNFSGAAGLAEKLDQFGAKSQQVAKTCLYDGAGIVADAIRASVDSIPVFVPDGTWHRPMPGLFAEDLADLKSAIDIARFQDTADGPNTQIGFGGYARRKEKDFPSGVPIALLARSIESGSSVRQKHPFFRRAVNASKAKAVAAMQQRLNEEIKELNR